jgi:hypothetical protein
MPQVFMYKELYHSCDCNRNYRKQPEFPNKDKLLNIYYGTLTQWNARVHL